MSALPKHMIDRDGRYFARVVVPVELRSVIGKSELREALGPDRRTAEKRLHFAVARFLDRIEAARIRQRVTSTLTLVPTVAKRPLTTGQLAVAHYHEELEIDTKLRDSAFEDGTPIIANNGVFRAGLSKNLELVASGQASNELCAATIGWAIDKFRRRGNTEAKEGTPEWRALCRELALVQLEIHARLEERDSAKAEQSPALKALKDSDLSQAFKPPVPIRDLVEGYSKELAASGKGAAAKARWEPVWDSLEGFLGHDDARRITRPDIVRWKDHLITTHSAKTIKDVYLASSKAILGWAHDNQFIDLNPAQGVKVKAPQKKLTREKGFTTAEAQALLTAAKNYSPKKTGNSRTTEAAKTTAAKRWTPWLAAYTGSRITELTQLRKEDFRKEGDMWVVRITAEAGSTKGNYRDVPLHAHLVELGFMDFVNGAPPGPLFFEARIGGKKTSPAQTVSGRVSKWISSLKIIGEVQPNHGWRHRFKTIGLEVGIEGRVLDAIQGHATRTAGENYGDVTLRTKLNALSKIPKYSGIR